MTRDTGAPVTNACAGRRRLLAGDYHLRGLRIFFVNKLMAEDKIQWFRISLQGG
jgi:hypothetical protein